jgi:hypothetical protein
MRRLSIRLRRCAMVLAAAVLLTPSPRAAQPSTLPHLGGVDEVKTWFNSNKGHIKILLLLSPT